VNLIANTTTQTGLRVRAKLDTRSYVTGRKVARETMRGLAVKRRRDPLQWRRDACEMVRPGERDGGARWS